MFYRAHHIHVSACLVPPAGSGMLIFYNLTATAVSVKPHQYQLFSLRPLCSG